MARWRDGGTAGKVGGCDGGTVPPTDYPAIPPFPPSRLEEQKRRRRHSILAEVGHRLAQRPHRMLVQFVPQLPARIFLPIEEGDHRMTIGFGGLVEDLYGDRKSVV